MGSLKFCFCHHYLEFGNPFFFLKIIVLCYADASYIVYLVDDLFFFFCFIHRFFFMGLEINE